MALRSLAQGLFLTDKIGGPRRIGTVEYHDTYTLIYGTAHISSQSGGDTYGLIHIS